MDTINRMAPMWRLITELRRTIPYTTTGAPTRITTPTPVNKGRRPIRIHITTIRITLNQAFPVQVIITTITTITVIETLFLTFNLLIL